MKNSPPPLSKKMLERSLTSTDFSPCTSTNLNHLKAAEQQRTAMLEELDSPLNELNTKADSPALSLKRCSSSASCTGRSRSSSSSQRHPKKPSPSMTPFTCIFSSPPSACICLGRRISSSRRYPKNPSPNMTTVTTIFYSPPSDLCHQPSAQLLDETASINKEKQSSSKISIFMNFRSSYCKPFSGGKKSRMAEEGREGDEMDSVKASLRGYTTKRESRISVKNSKETTSAKRKELDGFLQNHQKKPQSLQKTKSVTAVQQPPRNEQESLPIGNEFAAPIYDDLPPDCLSALTNKDQEERKRNRSHNRSTGGTRATIPFSDGQCTGGSECRDSDIESSINEHMRSFAPTQSKAGDPTVANMERNELEAQHLEWTEATILKLVNRLRKKEAEISEWEYKKTLKYKAEMKHLERKIYEKREKMYLKMQKKMRKLEKEAEEKKVKETEIIAWKISKISDAVQRINGSGKLPWMTLPC